MKPQRLISVLFTLGFVACAGHSNDVARPAGGALGGACYPNGTCDAGLSCNAGTCEPAASRDGGGSAPCVTTGGGGGSLPADSGNVGGGGTGGWWATPGGSGNVGGGTGGWWATDGGAGNIGGSWGDTGGSYSSAGGSGTGGGLGQGGVGPSMQCGQSTCTAKPFPGDYHALSTDGSHTALACCAGATGDRCGLLISGDCVELGQPGNLTSHCSGLNIGGPILEGCCKPDLTCGAVETVLGLGCFFSPSLNTKLLSSAIPDWCQPDAGAP